MSVELSIVGGLGLITGVFAYIAFQFWHTTESDDGVSWERRLALLFFILTVFGVDLLMYTVYLIAANNSITYLQNGILLVALGAVMWLTLGGLALYTLILTIMGLGYLYDVVTSWGKGRDRRKSDFE